MDALYLSYCFILVDLTIFFTIARIVLIENDAYELNDESDEEYDTADEYNEVADQYDTSEEEEEDVMNYHLSRDL